MNQLTNEQHETLVLVAHQHGLTPALVYEAYKARLLANFEQDLRDLAIELEGVNDGSL